jgi:hypothetical protein
MDLLRLQEEAAPDAASGHGTAGEAGKLRDGQIGIWGQNQILARR